ncbi:MAG: hypothetical protein JNJ78_15080 [Anaerolineae bacterium]|nr:hypothetical protein [Anaerolineae bacterium]
MEKPKRSDDILIEKGQGGRIIGGLLLIVVGVLFLLMYAGLFDFSMIGAFFGTLGGAIGSFFGSLGGAIGTFFGSVGTLIGRFWPAILIFIGLIILFVPRRSPR